MSLIFTISMLCMVVLLSCKKDDGAFIITFLSPKEGDSVSNATDVNIEVKFEAPDELEAYEINLSLDSVGAANIAPFPLIGHDHVQTKTVMQSVNLSSYPAGTAFRLKASLCKNHDCTEKLDQSIRFFIP